jgi:hypothetical protein
MQFPEGNMLITFSAVRRGGARRFHQVVKRGKGRAVSGNDLK